MGWTPADILSLVTALLNSGIIEAVVRAIERLLPGASGEEKRDKAMEMVGVDLPDRAKPILSAAVDAVVDEYNETGVFVHRVSVPGDAVGS